MSFPTPVGGTPLPEDFAPSIVFATLYGLLVPVIFYRMYYKHSRTPLLMGCMLFTMERIVMFSIRALQSHNESKRYSSGFLKYMQVSLTVGYLGVAGDLANILRVYLVNPSFGSEKYAESPAARDEQSNPESSWAFSRRRAFRIFPFRPFLREGSFPGEPPEGTPDHPRTRFWARRLTDFANLGFIAAAASGGIGNAHFKAVTDDPAGSKKIMLLRYESTGLGLFLLLIIAIATIWGKVKLSRVSTRGARILLLAWFLLSNIGIYRLFIMFHETTSLASRAPESLNSRGDKTTFYVLHVLPEWLTLVILFTSNVRQIFGTGLLGDYRYRDETAKDRQKREMKEAKKADSKRRQNQLAEMSWGRFGDSDSNAPL